MHIRIATRKSELALWQARHVADQLRALESVADVELVPLSTRGDDILDRSLQKIGGKGLFIKELEIAMQAGRADIAVHSMKDVPAEMPSGFCIAAVLPRANPADALVSADGGPLESIQHGGKIGSSSLRRQAQLRVLRPDLVVEPLRGNVNTRLAKLKLGQFDAIVLAAAGLERLGLGSQIAQQFSTEQMLPAAAQGVIGIECLEHRGDLREILGKINDANAARTTAAERAVAHELQASCHSPVASYATLDGDSVHLRALVAAVDGTTVLNESARGPAADGQALGMQVAQQLIARGADALLQQ